MIRHLKTHASLVALAAAIYSAGSPAYAQEDPPRTASVEEVVVSAQRREQRLQDVPIAVTALSADQLETRGVGELNNISREIPNIQFMPAPGNGASTAVFARGAEAANPGFNTSESPIGFYQDDVYRGRLSTANFDFADIERIEALRGPQATLYGRNTLSGAVKLYSRTPKNDGWLKGSVGVGNWESLKGSFSAGGPLIQDQLGASFAVVVNRQGKGYFVDETGLGRNIGNSDNLSARGKLHWFGSDKAALTLNHDFIGRAALEREAANPRRKMVTLEWNIDDIVDVYASQFRPGEPYMPMEWNHASQFKGRHQMYADQVLKNGERIGVSSGRMYSYFYRQMISLCSIDTEHSTLGDQVSVLWGDPGTRQKEIRATIARYPYLTEPRNEHVDVNTIPCVARK